MTSSPLTVWCNLQLPGRALAALQSGLGPHRLLRAAESTTCFQPLGRPDPALAEADIAFGQPEADQCLACTRLLWVHLASAGYTTFAGDDIRAPFIARGMPLTNSSLVYDEPCAQHALAFMLAEARQLPASIRDQAGAHAWNTQPTRAASFLMKGQTVLLVGYGAIAKRLAELLAPFGLHLIGFRRHPRGDETIDVHAMAELSKWLPRADWVIDILPPAVDGTQLHHHAPRGGRPRGRERPPGGIVPGQPRPLRAGAGADGPGVLRRARLATPA